MGTKIVKKTKIKFVNLLLVLLVLVGLFFAVKVVLNEKIHTIVVKGNNYLKDDYLLELANIKDYPSYFLLNRGSACKKVMKSSYVRSCKISKKWNYGIVLKIEEEKPLFYDMNKNKYIFNNSSGVGEDEISKNFRVPRLLNYVPDTKYNKFISGMGIVKEDTLSKISDI